MEDTAKALLMIDEVTSELNSARIEIHKIQTKLEETQPNLEKGDIRLYYFTQIDNVLLDTIIGYKLSAELNSIDWWYKNFPEAKAENVPGRIEIFQKSLKINLVNLPFNLTEDAFRQLIRAVDPDACNGGKAAFESVYKCLLKSLNVKYDESLLNLYRVARNCQHNNGYYFPDRSSASKDITYRGVQYHFPYGQQVRYQTGLPILDILKDLANTYFEMCQSEVLKKYQR